jgi:hypothetical protein
MIATFQGGPADGLTVDTDQSPYHSGLPGSFIWLATPADRMFHQYECREAGRYEYRLRAPASRCVIPPGDGIVAG